MKKLITIVLTLICTVLYAQTGNFNDLLNKGKAEFTKEFEQQDYKKAVTYLEQAVKLQPNNAEARYFLGYAYSRLNAKDGLKMIESNLDLLYKASEQFEKVIALSPKYTGETVLLDPYSKLTAEWGSMAMKYLYQNKPDSARWAFREGKKRGGFSDFMLDISRKTLDACNSSTAILATWGDNVTFPLYYLQTVEKYRPDIAIVDMGLLQTQWYFDYLKNNKIVDFSLSSREYAAMGEIIKWDDTKITIYTLTWTVKPSYYGRYITRGEKAFLDLLQKNEFYKRNVFFTAGFPEESQLNLTDYLMPMVLVNYVSPANPSYAERGIKNPASYYEAVFPKYLKTGEYLNMNSTDERKIFDYVRFYLLKEIAYYLKIGEDKTAKNLFEVLHTFADNKKIPYLDEELNEYVDYLRKNLLEQTGKNAAKAQNKVQIAGNKNLTFTVNGVPFEMIFVEGGTFTMGCTSELGECQDDAKPAHKVTLPDYYMSQYEVTQQLWQAVMGTTIYQQRELANPNWQLRGEGDNFPMYYINYDECVNFCKKLNKLLAAQLPEDYKFAIPTEAQWEYAARGGNKSKGYKYSGSNNASEVAWFRNNSGVSTHPVGLKGKNELGLYDMSGNVDEWCSDLYNSKYYAKSPAVNPQGPATASTPDKEPVQVIRGGSWGDYVENYHVAHRSYNLSSYGGAYFGLRLTLVQ
ncbi:MAG: SUMF1/EgtB/PvdO family nonheme iron enzyme [Bacteroidetes bacterium]|nr:SUMF1/EgtB/PvdO family nonheme iron enzyme [Bacteroidota bacterium]